LKRAAPGFRRRPRSAGIDARTSAEEKTAGAVCAGGGLVNW
jgi:hypothetical protein